MTGSFVGRTSEASDIVSLKDREKVLFVIEAAAIRLLRHLRHTVLVLHMGIREKNN